MKVNLQTNGDLNNQLRFYLEFSWEILFSVIRAEVLGNY